jgi:hypothetical protein
MQLSNAKTLLSIRFDMGRERMSSGKWKRGFALLRHQTAVNRLTRNSNEVDASLIAHTEADEYLQQLADMSGGIVERADRLGDLKSAFARIAEELRHSIFWDITQPTSKKMTSHERFPFAFRGRSRGTLATRLSTHAVSCMDQEIALKTIEEAAARGESITVVRLLSSEPGMNRLMVVQGGELVPSPEDRRLREGINSAIDRLAARGGVAELFDAVDEQGSPIQIHYRDCPTQTSASCL